MPTIYVALPIFVIAIWGWFLWRRRRESGKLHYQKYEKVGIAGFLLLMLDLMWTGVFFTHAFDEYQVLYVNGERFEHTVSEASSRMFFWTFMLGGAFGSILLLWAWVLRRRWKKTDLQAIRQEYGSQADEILNRTTALGSKDPFP